MSRMICAGCPDGKENRCDGCSIYRLAPNVREAAKISIMLKKLTPKKPRVIYGKYTYCPSCCKEGRYFPVDNKDFGVELSESCMEEISKVTYCKHCGQAIDWSEVE